MEPRSKRPSLAAAMDRLSRLGIAGQRKRSDWAVDVCWQASGWLGMGLGWNDNAGFPPWWGEGCEGFCVLDWNGGQESSPTLPDLQKDWGPRVRLVGTRATPEPR